MKIVTVCRGGNVRSVATKLVLQNLNLNHQVIAIGHDNTDDETKKLLFEWADDIVFLVPEFSNHWLAQRKYQDKINILDVGNDIWGNPFDKKLINKIIDIFRDRNNKLMHLTGGQPIRGIDEACILAKIDQYLIKIYKRNQNDSAV